MWVRDRLGDGGVERGACMPRLSITSDALLTGRHHSNVSDTGRIVSVEISAADAPAGSNNLLGFFEIWRVPKVG